MTGQSSKNRIRRNTPLTAEEGDRYPDPREDLRCCTQAETEGPKLVGPAFPHKVQELPAGLVCIWGLHLEFRFLYELVQGAEVGSGPPTRRVLRDDKHPTVEARGVEGFLNCRLGDHG